MIMRWLFDLEHDTGASPVVTSALLLVLTIAALATLIVLVRKR